MALYFLFALNRQTTVYYPQVDCVQVGLDYLHGTGHGVGSFLNVHEGPCGISYRCTV